MEEITETNISSDNEQEQLSEDVGFGETQSILLSKKYLKELAALPNDEWNLPSLDIINALKDCIEQLELMVQQSNLFYTYPYLIEDIVQHVVTNMWEMACEVLKEYADSINWDKGRWFAYMHKVIYVSIHEFLNELKYPFTIPRQVRFGIIRLEKVMLTLLPYFNNNIGLIKSYPQLKCILYNKGVVTQACSECNIPCVLVDVSQRDQVKLLELISEGKGSIEKSAKSYKVEFDNFIRILIRVMKYAYEYDDINVNFGFVYHPENVIDIKQIKDKMDEAYSKILIDEDNNIIEIGLSDIYLSDLEYQSPSSMDCNVLYMPHRRVTSELLKIFKIESSDRLKELLAKGDEIVNEERQKTGIIPFQRKVRGYTKEKKTV